MSSLRIFFFHCQKVQLLWLEIQRDKQSHLNVSVKLDEKCVILGIVAFADISNSHLNTINQAIAIGKLSISKFRYGKQRNILEIYETDSNLRKLWA